MHTPQSNPLSKWQYNAFLLRYAPTERADKFKHGEYLIDFISMLQWQDISIDLLHFLEIEKSYTDHDTKVDYSFISHYFPHKSRNINKLKQVDSDVESISQYRLPEGFSHFMPQCLRTERRMPNIFHTSPVTLIALPPKWEIIEILLALNLPISYEYSYLSYPKLSFSTLLPDQFKPTHYIYLILIHSYLPLLRHEFTGLETYNEFKSYTYRQFTSTNQSYDELELKKWLWADMIAYQLFDYLLEDDLFLMYFITNQWNKVKYFISEALAVKASLFDNQLLVRSHFDSWRKKRLKFWKKQIRIKHLLKK